MPVTYGKVHQSPGQLRITRQPYLKNGWIWRKSGVDRVSERVIAANKKFADHMLGKTGAESPAGKCKGKPRPQFFSCLRKEGMKNIPKGSIAV